MPAAFRAYTAASMLTADAADSLLTADASPRDTTDCSILLVIIPTGRLCSARTVLKQSASHTSIAHAASPTLERQIYVGTEWSGWTLARDQGSLEVRSRRPLALHLAS